MISEHHPLIYIMTSSKTDSIVMLIRGLYGHYTCETFEV